MKLNLWWILMGEKEFLTISLWKNIHWWCPKQILSPALSQSCIWKERWSVEVLGWVSGVSCTDCRCPSPKPRATTPSWASLVPSSEHLEQCWECLRYCCTCLSTPHPPGIHVGFQSHSCHPPPAPTTGMTPILGYPSSNNSHYPESWGISAPRMAITPNSWNPSSNNRNSPNLTVSSQTKSKGNLKTLFFFANKASCSVQGKEEGIEVQRGSERWDTGILKTWFSDQLPIAGSIHRYWTINQCALNLDFKYLLPIF